MEKRNRKGLSRERKFYRKTLFYGGFLADGSPRGWNLTDLLIVAGLLSGILVVGFFLFEWLQGHF